LFTKLGLSPHLDTSTRIVYLRILTA
jgi:hypothetical protein